MQKTVSKSHLKANMLKIFRELEAAGEELIVTDNNTPVLLIRPLRQTESVQQLFGGIQGRVIYHEELDVPTTGEWETA